MAPFSRISRRGALWFVLIALALTGCQKARTADEVKREYALKLLEGFSVGFFDIQAERADPSTYTLYNLTIASGDSIIHAERANIIVDAGESSVALELHDVVGADAETGLVMSLNDMKSGAIKLPGAVKN